jgi:AcrR family transcriptional regulator
MGRRPRVQRAEVLRAARAAFAERGFEGTTLAAIAARLGVSAAALLRHAEDKEALFRAAMADPEPDAELPMSFLADLSGDEDPRAVLRRLGEAFVPFAEARIGESIVRWQRAEAGAPTIGLAFPAAHVDKPRRGLALVESYFRRAKRAGRLETDDPKAAALAFMAALQSYVFLHRVMRVCDPPMPLPRYLDTLLDIWTHGALRPARTARSARKPRTP